MPAQEPKRRSERLALVTALGAAAIAAIAGFASVYVTLGRPDNAVRPVARAPSAEAERPAAAPAGPGANPLSQGQMAAFIFRKAPEDLPEVKFQDASGQERTLAEWRGKVVLLNLWATWCLPCRKEMPALDRLQREMASDQFEVVAVSVEYIPPDDEQALAAAISQAVTNPHERRRRGEQAAGDAREHYGWRAVATRIATLYRETTEEHSAQRSERAARGLR